MCQPFHYFPTIGSDARMRIVSQTIARFRLKRFSKSPPLRPIVLTASVNVRHAHAFQAPVFQDRCSELRISNSASEAGVVGHDRPKPLIRARSVVQVHPGPPFKSPVNTRLFSLFPFSGISLTKPFCQPFVNFTVSRMPLGIPGDCDRWFRAIVIAIPDDGDQNSGLR